MDRNELAWAAGLFEGEGCIGIQAKGRKGTMLKYPQMELGMLDEDVVRHFQQAVGLGRITDTARRKGGVFYVWRANSFENSQAVIAMLWPHLGQRRRSRASEVFNDIAASQIHRKRKLRSR